jgi:hypothetical protein
MMSIGELDKEIKTYDRMAANKPEGLNPVAQEQYWKYKRAMEQAKEISKNAPEGFRPMPVSEHYGKLSGAMVRKPVYDDIVPLVRGLVDPTSGWSKIIKGFETATTAFKVSKVPLNPPTIIRNMISNLFQMNMSGIPFGEVPFVWGRGINSFFTKDKFYRQFERYGGYHTNFTVAELGEIKSAFAEVIQQQRKGKWRGYWPLDVAVKLAKYYGRIDDIAKLSIYRHAVTRRGMSPGRAAVHSMRWGMDYSLAPPTVKGARRTVIPFISYQYKIAPLIWESLRKRPWVIAKFAAIPWLAIKAAAYKYDWSDKDVERVQKELAERTRHKDNFIIVPFKDDRGRIKFMNVEYYFPWGQIQSFLADVSKADAMEAKDAFPLGGWWANIIGVWTTRQRGKPPVDPFSGLNIFSRFDAPHIKTAKFSWWSTKLFAPGAFTEYGALGHTKRAITGERDKWGKEVSVGDAIGRWFGANLGVLDKRQMKKIRRAKEYELFRDFRSQYHDPRTSRQEKIRLKRRLKELRRKIRRGEK